MNTVLAFIKEFQYYDLVILLILTLLLLRYATKSYIRTTLLRIVLHIDTFQESESGRLKLKLARQTFLLTISRRFRMLSLALDFLIPESLFSRMVDETLESLKHILAKQKQTQSQKVEVLSTEILETLKSQEVEGNPNLTTNEQIEREISRIKSQVEDKQGYAKLYAKYSEKDKANIGAEIGIKF